MSNLKIYKASAGSGKTYKLTEEYINLLKINEDNYRHTLAVTFTKLATAEMKVRILKKLDEDSRSNNRLEGARAKNLLNRILNDYSNFNINTIDSFFQSILRSFAIELNLDNNFRLEMDSEWIIEKATINLISEANKNPEMVEWLAQFANDKIDNGLAWNLKTDIKEFGYQLNKEAFQKISKEEFETIANLESIHNYRIALQNIEKAFADKVILKAKVCTDFLDKNGFNFPANQDKLAGKSRSPLKYVYDLAKNGAFEKETHIASVEKILLDDSKSFFSDKKIDSQTDSYTKSLIVEIIDFYQTNIIEVNSAKIVLKKLFALGLVSKLKLHFDALCKEEEIFPIANTQSFINRIIDENDAPFIYEKVGSFYNNFMIDEFQDTSQLQWNNISPLVQNSLASEYLSLVVGDVKQAIYRFRNSDWNLLNSKILTEYKNQTETIPLESNYRSDKNITYFNNTIFPYFATLIGTTLESEMGDSSLSETITRIFSDAYQKIGNEEDKGEGYVEVRFLPEKKVLHPEASNEEENETEDGVDMSSAEGSSEESADENLNKPYTQNALYQTFETIEQLTKNIANPFKHKDICILVRGRAESKTISKYLLSKGTPLLNTTALTLGNSEAILWIISSVRHIIHQHNNLLKYEINYHYKQLHGKENPGILDSIDILAQKPLFEMIEGIVALMDDAVQKEYGIYLQAFIDYLTSYYSDYNPNIHEFLAWWDDVGYLKTINIPTNVDAVQLMTIHGSKGLEFKVVIVPFANAKLDQGHGDKDLIWVKPLVEPFNALPIVPVAYTSALKNSIFRDDFYTERINRLVDSLNVLYVALTRPTKALYIFTTEKEDASKGTLSYATLLNNLKGHQPVEDEKKPKLINLNLHFDSEQNALIIGDARLLNTIKEEKKEGDILTEIPLTKYHTIPYEERLAVKLEQESYQSLTDRDTKRKRGTELHKIFEYIHYATDVEKAINKTIREGLILEKEKAELLKLIQTKLSHPEVAQWFSAEKEVKTEATILAHKTYRPDRIVISPTKDVWIVDYKFGEKQSDSYKKQLADYMAVVTKMGYTNVMGRIWYVMMDEIVEV